MANKKDQKTKKDWFVEVIEIVRKSDYPDKTGAIDFLNHEVELLNKKSDKSKESKRSKEHATIMATIMEVLAEVEKPITISEMLEDSRLAVYEEETKDEVKIVKMTNQKLSSVVKKLVDAKEVIRTEEKKKAYFSLPEVEEDNNTDEVESEPAML